jgi:hypothetical protein
MPSELLGDDWAVLAMIAKDLKWVATQQRYLVWPKGMRHEPGPIRAARTIRTQI